MALQTTNIYNGPGKYLRIDPITGKKLNNLQVTKMALQVANVRREPQWAHASPGSWGVDGGQTPTYPNTYPNSGKIIHPDRETNLDKTVRALKASKEGAKFYHISVDDFKTMQFKVEMPSVIDEFERWAIKKNQLKYPFLSGDWGA